MLNKLYKISDGNFNPAQEIDKKDDSIIKKRYKNLNYYTKDFGDVFDNIKNEVIFRDISKQQDHIRKEIILYEKYDYFNKKTSEKLLEQYNAFYFYKGFFYSIFELREWLVKKQGAENTFIKSDVEDFQEEEISNSKKTLTVSREAIRKITGYSPYVIPSWSETRKPLYIEWQDTILQDESPIIIVDGSRQIGKSLTIAEKAVEISFLPNEDTLVGGFIKKTTDVIRNYMLKHIKSFPDGIFEHFKSEGYILNTKSGTRIYFRTLDNDAQNVLGLTLKNVIVDEAQLVSTYVFEEVLEPTLATTNGKMILIGTPGYSAKGYYYQLIMEAKKWIEFAGIKIAVKSEDNPDVSYYQIDITQNPLIAPRIRAKVMRDPLKPSNQRQYFCNWNSGEDQLFKPIKANKYPNLSQEGYFVITFDPAKKGKDRSAFCVTYTYDGKVTIILSGFMPKVLKKQWTKQINYYAKGLMKKFGTFKNLICGVDLRGVGEGFTEAWKNYFKKPNPSFSLIEITYTTGDTETIDGLEWKVSKTRLISTGRDMMDEELVEIVSVTNKDLEEEYQFLYEDEDNKGRLAMKSTFLDDIANASLTNLFIIHIRKYLKRSVILEKPQGETFKEWNDDFVSKKDKKRKLSSIF